MATIWFILWSSSWQVYVGKFMPNASKCQDLDVGQLELFEREIYTTFTKLYKRILPTEVRH